MPFNGLAMQAIQFWIFQQFIHRQTGFIRPTLDVVINGHIVVVAIPVLAPVLFFFLGPLVRITAIGFHEVIFHGPQRVVVQLHKIMAEIVALCGFQRARIQLRRQWIAVAIHLVQIFARHMGGMVARTIERRRSARDRLHTARTIPTVGLVRLVH